MEIFGDSGDVDIQNVDNKRLNVLGRELRHIH